MLPSCMQYVKGRVGQHPLDGVQVEIKDGQRYGWRLPLHRMSRGN